MARNDYTANFEPNGNDFIKLRYLEFDELLLPGVTRLKLFFPVKTLKNTVFLRVFESIQRFSKLTLPCVFSNEN